MNENNRILAWGHFQNSGRRVDCSTMFVESNPHVTEMEEATVQLRLGVFSESGSLELATLRESAIQLSTKQAHELALHLLNGVAQAIEMQTIGCSASGILLIGKSDFLVGLSDLNFLRVPLDSFPAVRALSEDQRTAFRFLPDRSGLEWPELGLRLPLSELIQKAVAIEDGVDGPK